MHASFICVTWLIHMCDMTISYAWHDVFICVRLMHVCTCLCSHTTTRALINKRHTYLMRMTWLIHMCDTTHSLACHDHFISVTRIIHMRHVAHSYVSMFTHNHTCFTKEMVHLPHSCDMTHSMCDMTISCVWHDSFICVTPHLRMCQCPPTTTRTLTNKRYNYLIHVWYDSFTCVRWLLHMCDMIVSCVTRLIHMRYATWSYAPVFTHIHTHIDKEKTHILHICDDDSFTCVTWLIHMCDMAISYVRHDSFMCVKWHIRMCLCSHTTTRALIKKRHTFFMHVTWLIHVCDTTISCVWHDSFMCITWHSCMWLCSHTTTRALIKKRHTFFKHVTWLIRVCDTTHSCASHGAFVRACVHPQLHTYPQLPTYW